MRWVVSETNERMGTAAYWAFYLVQEGERPACEAVRVSKGYWFVSAEGGDPAGKRLYDEGRAKAEAEAARLNRAHDRSYHAGLWAFLKYALNATEHQLRELTYYDALTGLPNRKLCLKTLEEFINQKGQGHTGLLLLLDINNLKKINDTLGHKAGDQALQAIASRLGTFCQSTGSVARWGGDEFTVIVKHYGGQERARALAQSMLSVLNEPIRLGYQDVFLSASVGIACFPQDAQQSEDLIHHADLALHRAKAEGRNVFRFYEDSMRDRLQEDLQIESALHGALERDELHLVFQPVVRSSDRSVVGLEALLRWESPTLGTVPPARFIPQLERNGLIVPIGRWVLATACREVAAMPPRGAQPMRLAVNVSARQLLHRDFVPDVKAVLEDSGLDAGRLELEITESVLIENAEVASDVLRELRLLGVRIAADDFGTGYSSLSYLWKLPFSTLKIDRSFVTAMTDDDQVRVIIGSILNLASSLGLTVVAEGIEMAEQFEALRKLECPLIQGYWTGRPMRMADLKARFAAPIKSEVRFQELEEMNE